MGSRHALKPRPPGEHWPDTADRGRTVRLSPSGVARQIGAGRKSASLLPAIFIAIATHGERPPLRTSILRFGRVKNPWRKVMTGRDLGK